MVWFSFSVGHSALREKREGFYFFLVPKKGRQIVFVWEVKDGGHYPLVFVLLP